MANSFLDALEKTAVDIGKNIPRAPRAQSSGMFPNITSSLSNAGMPKTSMSTPATIPNMKLGTVTVRPGESTRYEKSHPGIDIANAIGTQLPAFTGGAVTAVQTGRKKGSPGFGNYVIITDKDGNKHRYSHLERSMVKIGDAVKPGQVIGTMGNTGQTYSLSGGTGSHLDYRILNAFGKYVDPTIYTNALTGT